MDALTIIQQKYVAGLIATACTLEQIPAEMLTMLVGNYAAFELDPSDKNKEHAMRCTANFIARSEASEFKAVVNALIEKALERNTLALIILKNVSDCTSAMDKALNAA
jgi:hypothetical protein